MVYKTQQIRDNIGNCNLSPRPHARSLLHIFIARYGVSSGTGHSYYTLHLAKEREENKTIVGKRELNWGREFEREREREILEKSNEQGPARKYRCPFALAC